mgnify:FL=1|jgi:putative FmdB family regulatory protein|tara:strand:+ start:30520 stop:30771 length:252 start_codon:yes stop_codon:yes gene_type:complete
MPTYIYHCYECEGEFKTRHGMKESCDECEWCGSLNLVRVPSNFSTLRPLESKKKEKVGDLVKDFIKDSQQELSQQKDNLKKER